MGKEVKKQKKRKKFSKKSLIINSIFVVAGLAIVAIVLAYSAFHYYYSLLDYHPDEADQFVMDSVSTDSISENIPYDIYTNVITGSDVNSVVDVGEFYDGYIDEATDEELLAIKNGLSDNVEDMQSILYDTGTYNILLIGVDARTNTFSGRSDSMIVVSIDKASKKVVMASVLRDTFVTIPGYSDNRLNAAYAWGGAGLLKDTLRSNFGIKIDSYMAVNFFLVKDIVDSVGGIDIYLSGEEIKQVNGLVEDMNILLGEPKGTDNISIGLSNTVVHLNGKQALSYARVRYVGTDFARTDRQREVIMQCLGKIKGMSLSDLNLLAGQYLPRIRTDLSEKDCLSFITMALDIDSYKIESMKIPIDNTWSNANIRGMAVLNIDFKANSEAWYKAVTGEDYEY